MAETFGSDAFFIGLKRAREAGDRERFQMMFIEKVQAKAAVLMQRFPYTRYSREDREDAIQETVLYMLGKADAFMDDPRNDPESGREDGFGPLQRQRWLAEGVSFALKHHRVKVFKHADVDSLNREFDGGDGGSLMDITPSRQPTPEQNLMRRERLAEAFRKLFSLGNAPELLAAMGYMLLEENLLGARRSQAQYAELLNGMRVGELLDMLEASLAEAEIDIRVMAPLRSRVKDAGTVIEGMNPRNMANRKNSILTTLRTDPNDEED